MCLLVAVEGNSIGHPSTPYLIGMTCSSSIPSTYMWHNISTSHVLQCMAYSKFVVTIIIRDTCICLSCVYVCRIMSSIAITILPRLPNTLCNTHVEYKSNRNPWYKVTNAWTKQLSYREHKGVTVLSPEIRECCYGDRLGQERWQVKLVWIYCEAGSSALSQQTSREC